MYYPQRNDPELIDIANAITELDATGIIVALTEPRKYLEGRIYLRPKGGWGVVFNHEVELVIYRNGIFTTITL